MAAAATAAEPDTSEADRWAQLQRWLDDAPQPQTVRARFEQERHSPLLAEPVRSRGRLWSAGDVAKLALDEPAPLEMRIGPGRMEILYVQDRVLEVYPAMPQTLPITAARPDLQQLAEGFRLRELAESDGNQATATLEAHGDMRDHLVSLEIMFDRARGVVTGAALVDPAGDQTVMTLADIEIGAEVTGDDLALSAPTGVRVVYPAGQPGDAEAR
ncbi:MAG: outer membrane lipoprotein carrier protein LolA [Planctomycetota bacterium]